jgi:hypothetical protein
LFIGNIILTPVVHVTKERTLVENSYYIEIQSKSGGLEIGDMIWLNSQRGLGADCMKGYRKDLCFIFIIVKL